MTWEEEFDSWVAHRAKVRGFDEVAPFEARKLVGESDALETQWLRSALGDSEKKWFVADVCRSQPVSESFLPELIRAAVYERDPSFNRVFLEPCTRDFGAPRVFEALLQYLRTGSDEEKAGAASATYWVRLDDSDAARVLRDALHAIFLKEFVGNPAVEVRQRIIPQLVLEVEAYPEALRPLVSQAIAIARAHPDSYIRHRVEIQLGTDGPLMPIPTARSASYAKKKWWQFWK